MKSNGSEDNTMKGLSKAAMIVARILEIGHWVGTGIFAVLLVCCMVAKDAAVKMIAGDPSGEDVIYGFHFTLTNAAGEMNMASLTVLAVAGIILFALMAVIFRNIYLIIKTSRGETKFSRGATPFQPEVVRMLKKVGILSIAVPVVGFIMSIVFGLVVGPESDATANLDLSGIFMGLIILWLTQVFSYGVQLEGDAEGLI